MEQENKGLGASADADRAGGPSDLSRYASQPKALIPSACERLQAHERLLSREQIAALTDLEWLEAELDKVTSDAKAIEVDLEFRSDDLADEEWEHRARRALTAHHICAGHLTRRIAFIRRGEKKGPSSPDHDAKARKKEAEAARLAAAAENKRLKAGEEREKTVRAMVAYADRQSFLAHFYRVARETLNPNTFRDLAIEARASLESAMLAELPAQGGVTEGGDCAAGSGSEASSTRSPQGDAPEGDRP